jgi:hypothetical protein
MIPDSENLEDHDVREFTFFMDAEAYGLGGYVAAALAADESDLHEAGIVAVDIPSGYGGDLGDRIPVRVRATARGLRFYAKLLGIRDPMQLDELQRVCSAQRRSSPEW